MAQPYTSGSSPIPPLLGIAERGDLISGSSDRWQQTLDVDLKAVSKQSRAPPLWQLLRWNWACSAVDAPVRVFINPPSPPPQVLEGVRLAARSMLTGSPDTPPSRPASPGSGKEGQPPEQWRGVIMVTASAGGTFPMPLRCGALAQVV